MLNTVILVGRVKDKPKLIKNNDKEETTIILGVQRCFKNSDGIYDTDYLKCILWNNIATNTVEYVKAGDIVGIKGRLQASYYDKDDNEMEYITEVIVEKITFLTNKK